MTNNSIISAITKKGLAYVLYSRIDYSVNLNNKTGQPIEENHQIVDEPVTSPPAQYEMEYR